MTVTDALWIGWLYGNESDRGHLQSLGVFGPMIFKKRDNSQKATLGASSKQGIFSHCWVKDKDMGAVRGYLVYYESFSYVTGDDLKEYLKGHEYDWRGDD